MGISISLSTAVRGMLIIFASGDTKLLYKL